MKKKKQQIRLLILSLAALAVVAFFAWGVSRGLSKNHSTSRFPVQIQEYMSSNTLFPNENGVCTDWVELYNASDADIDIGGFKLTDRDGKSRFSIPSGTVLPGRGYYVIYCLRSGGDGYANFGISRNGGEDLMLLNRKNVLIDSVRTISLPENTSAERDEMGEFHISMTPSPGAASITAVSEVNTDVQQQALHVNAGAVCISEVIPGNTLYADERGLVADVVELYNASNAPVDLGGYVLQDGIDGNRLALPQGTVIEGGGYYVIRCARTQPAGLYADFALSRNGGDMLLLYGDTGLLVDYLTTEPCGKNESIVRVNGVVQVSSFATPGFANTEEGYAACLASYAADSPVRISEIMSSNNSYPFPDGSRPDWVELVNVSAAAVDISGWGLSDSAASVRYAFPAGTVLSPGEYKVVPCDGNAGKGADSAHFGVSSTAGETVFLTYPDGTLCAAAITAAAGPDAALVYDGGVTAAVSRTPTPGFANDEAGLAAYRAAAEQAVGAGLILSEVMPNNACTVATSDGRFLDWVELYNAGARPVDLSGFCLSDREDDLTRFVLPAVSLAPGEYALVYCSKEGAGAGSDVLAPFGLSAKGGTVLLSAVTGAVVDSVTYLAMEDDRAMARMEQGGFRETDFPTPGFPNTGAGYKAFLTSWVPEGLYISEAMPSNRTVARTGGAYYDWVELCNGLSEPVSLQAYTLTDDPAVPDKYTLPEMELESGRRLLLYCSGDASLTDRTAWHCPFKLNGGEDRLYLYRNGRLADYLHIYKVPAEGSIGRNDRTGGTFLYEMPTPGKANKGGVTAEQLSAMPTSDTASGIYENTESFYVTLSGPGTIYYTTDGSKPTQKSAVYSEPIRISKTSVLRAAALEVDKRMSEVLTLAYTVNEGHGLPVVNLVLAPADFRGTRGIYSNPDETWQREGCLVYTDANGTVTHDCGIRLAGQHSRHKQQKSFKLVFSDQYGGRLRYDIFGADCEQTTFPELKLRAGLDAKYGIFREPLIQQMAMPYRDTTFVQDSVPCVVYINGEYYGIYQFMESICEETIADRLGVQADSITMYKGYMYPGHNYLEIYRLLKYVEIHSLKDDKSYEYVKSHLALEDLIDWAIFEGFCRNTDLSGNVRYFMSTETDGRWHFVFYDVECSFTAFGANFDAVLSDGQTATFLKALLRNSEFKDMFLKRLAYHCENTFDREKTLTLLYAYDAAVRPETERHFKRWDLQPITYVYNFNQIERHLKADRAGELKQSARRRLNLSDEEYARYFGV